MSSPLGLERTEYNFWCKEWGLICVHRRQHCAIIGWEDEMVGGDMVARPWA